MANFDELGRQEIFRYIYKYVLSCVKKHSMFLLLARNQKKNQRSSYLNIYFMEGLYPKNLSM